MAQSKTKLDYGTLILLALILTMSALTVAASEWAPGLDMLMPTGLAGLLLGTLITRSRFRRLTAHLIGLGYGAAWITFVSMGHLPAAAAGDLGEKFIAYGHHIGEWIWLLLQTGIGKDNFIFLLSLMIVFWLLGYSAAWHTFRAARVLRVILPPGLVILVNLYYYGGKMQLSLFLYLYFIFVLLYLARIHYARREREWRRARVGFDDDVRGSFVRGGSIVTVCAVLVAWAVPYFAPMPQFEDLWRQVSRPLRSIEDSFNRLFSSLEGQGPSLTNPFGRTIGFGGPRHLSDTVLMDVYLHKTTDNAHALARYWRAGTYDTYTSNGWISSAAESFVFGPDSDPLDPPYLLRSNVRQTFTFYFPRTSLLLAAAQPVYFNRDAEADARLVTSSSASGAASQLLVDPSFVTSRDLVRTGDAYDAISSVSIADVEKLRLAGDAYPAWVTERYLQLPDNFPQRVKDLARQIVDDAGATNPFDQAATIERWLRRNIGYNEKIAGPEPGQDGVDYVLFTSHAGYCDYYASSMVTLLRSLGVPARVAVGYAKGDYESAGDVYRVRERDAHMWVEVFFPDFGWVEFEPTAAQPLINRPIPVDESPNSDDPPLAATPDPAEIDRANRFDELENDQFQPGGAADALAQALPRSLAVLIGVMAVGAVAGVGAIYVFENRGLRGMRGTRWAYARLVRLGRWLRVDLRAHQTPFEQADLLMQAAPGSRAAIHDIAGDFVRETFGRDGSGVDRARSTWRQTHLRLWWAGLKRRVLGAIRRRRRPDFMKLRFPHRRQ